MTANATTSIALPTPQILHITGADALAFAQAQFSSDLAALENGFWQWSAWLSAQGRVRAFFHLLRDDDENLRLVLRGGSATALRDALARYVLRAKVRLQVATDVAAWIEQRDDARTGAHASSPSRRIERRDDATRIALPDRATRDLVLGDTGMRPASADDSEAARNANDLADIDAGLVTLDAALSDKLLPTWIGLDALGATSTRKGCYPGQEIVARLHFKGGNKRWLHRIDFAAEHLPAPGEIVGEGGIVVCSAHVAAGHVAALAVLDERAGDFPRGDATTGITPESIARIGHLQNI